MECDCFIFLQYGENTGFFSSFLVDGSIIAARYGLSPWSFKKENINPWPSDPQRSPLRNLRRTRRRSLFHRVLPQHRPQLRVLLAVPRSHREIGRGAGEYQESQIKQVFTTAVCMQTAVFYFNKKLFILISKFTKKRLNF